jgi:hypothetical protein
MAATHLTASPQLIFIDASKQYRNTIKEIKLWSEYVNGFIVCHDVSLTAKGNQANGSLGVSDGMVDSEVFAQSELLLIDPKTEIDDTYPYLDPCGLGIAVSRGKRVLSRSGTAIGELMRKKRILEPDKLLHSENWFFEGKSWEFEPERLRKRAGGDGWAFCFAPVAPGQTLDIEVGIRDSNGGDIMICSGGNPGTSFRPSGNGKHKGQITVGTDNFRVAIYASAQSKFTLDHLRVTTAAETTAEQLGALALSP